jgi:hypothetical protein
MAFHVNLDVKRRTMGLNQVLQRSRFDLFHITKLQSAAKSFGITSQSVDPLAIQGILAGSGSIDPQGRNPISIADCLSYNENRLLAYSKTEEVLPQDVLIRSVWVNGDNVSTQPKKYIGLMSNVCSDVENQISGPKSLEDLPETIYLAGSVNK